MQNEKTIICPICKNECWINLDMYGSTPYHLHCDTCNYIINYRSLKETEKLVQKYSVPNIKLYYYNNKVQDVFGVNENTINKLMEIGHINPISAEEIKEALKKVYNNE